MRLGYIVTEFPKVTETFILRDLVEFDREGHDVRIRHLTPERKGEVIHDFARHMLAKARSRPFLLGASVLGALARAALRHPAKLAAVVGRIMLDCRRDPLMMLKSLVIIPKTLSFAEELHAWGADHIHAGFAGHPATAAWIVGRFTGIPYSVSCHANDIFVTQALLRPKLLEAAFIRSISEYNRTFLLDRIPGLAAVPIEVVHCGAYARRIEAAETVIVDPFDILYVGSLHPKKGVNILLRALSAATKLGQWTCDVIGGGPDAAALRRLAVDLGLSDRVRFHGPQPNEYVSRAFAKASVVVVPSVFGPGGRAEGIPTVIMEALAHRRPVIASCMTGIPELVRDGVTGYLVPVGDAAALAGALEKVRRDPETARDMAGRGRALVLDEYDAVGNADALLALMMAHSHPGGDHES